MKHYIKADDRWWSATPAQWKHIVETALATEGAYDLEAAGLRLRRRPVAVSVRQVGFEAYVCDAGHEMHLLGGWTLEDWKNALDELLTSTPSQMAGLNL